MQNQIKLSKRDANGLIEGLEYQFFEDTNLINWRAMIPSNWIVPNRQRTQETDITKLEDKDLILLLGGIKWAARTRGYESIRYPIIQASLDYCMVSCEIKFIPNIEQPNGIVVSGVGDAHAGSTTGNFARNFLGPIAENRAFVRCVRNALNINIVANDELGGTTSSLSINEESSQLTKTPHMILKELMERHHFSFENIRNKLIKEEVANAENFNTVEDIPVAKALNYIEKIREKHRD